MLTEYETEIQNRIRLEAAEKGCMLWRNNVGAAGRVRFGLANDSKQLNKKLKSADLIGIRPVLITQEMVGKTIGQFLSREIKRSDKKDSRTMAQQAWADLVNKFGGDAKITYEEGTI